MLMLSAAFFQLLAIMCLTLYTSVAFASPISIDVTPKPGLHRRRPLTNLCNPPIGWEWRQCVPERDPWTWQDVCSAGPRTALSGCLPTQVCENYIDEDGDRNIKCIDNFPAGQTKTRTEADEPLIGASPLKEAGISLYAWKFQHNVKITDNLGLSSVAANLLSEFFFFFFLFRLACFLLSQTFSCQIKMFWTLVLMS